MSPKLAIIILSLTVACLLALLVVLLRQLGIDSPKVALHEAEDRFFASYQGDGRHEQSDFVRMLGLEPTAIVEEQIHFRIFRRADFGTFSLVWSVKDPEHGGTVYGPTIMHRPTGTVISLVKSGG